ncbi:MAG: hypothetical protein AAFQ80_00990 [Cyanobacteria bacterium J06621_8]
MFEQLLTSVNTNKLILSIIIVVFTVPLIHIIRKIANINAPLTAIGTDLNLFTYGFLADLALKGLNGESFWEKYPPELVVNKNMALFLIITGNTLIMMINFKLEVYVKTLKNNRQVTPDIFRKINWIYKPGVLLLGLVSLSVYLFVSSGF